MAAIPTASQPPLQMQRIGSSQNLDYNPGQNAQQLLQSEEDEERESSTESEKQPPNNGSSQSRSAGVTPADTFSSTGARTGLSSLWRHRRKDLVAVSTVWFGYLCVTAAYSLLGPFFPTEVMSPTTVSIPRHFCFVSLSSG